MRASGAEERRTVRRRNSGIGSGGGLCSENCFRYQSRREFIHKRERILPGTGDTHAPYCPLDECVVFLNNPKFLHLRSKIPDGFLRQGPGHTQFQIAHPVAKRLSRMLITDAAREYAYFLIALHVRDERRRLVKLTEIKKTFFDEIVFRLRKDRKHRILRRIAGILTNVSFHPFACLDDALAVADTRRDAKENRCVKAFRDIKGGLHEIKTFLAVRRFEHRELCMEGIPAVVLFVLRAEKSGVVRVDDDETSVDADIRHREKRIRRHVQSHVLHGAHRPGPSH